MFLLLSWDLHFAKRRDKSDIKNLYRIGEPYKLEVQHRLPAITAKAVYNVLTGDYIDFNNFTEYYNKLNTQPKYIWDYANSKMILGPPVSESPVDLDTFNGVFFTTEQPPYSVIPPMTDNIKKYFDEDWLVYLSGLREHNIRDLREYTNAYHGVYKSLLSKYDEFDFTLVVYHLDRFTHIMRGSPLLDIYEWNDKQIGEILDMIEYKNVLAVTDHGAHHKPEAFICYSLEWDDLNNKKLKHYREVNPFIREILRRLNET